MSFTYKVVMTDMAEIPGMTDEIAEFICKNFNKGDRVAWAKNLYDGTGIIHLKDIYFFNSDPVVTVLVKRIERP